MQDKIDGATLILFNALFMCLMIPIMEHFSRTLSPGVEWIFFSVGLIGLALLGLFRLGLWLLRWRGWRQERQ
jgi:hypothetical protein